MFFVLGLTINNTFVDFIVVLVEVRWEADHKLIKQRTQTVNVSFSIVTLAKENLWAHVLRRSAEGM